VTCPRLVGRVLCDANLQIHLQILHDSGRGWITALVASVESTWQAAMVSCLITTTIVTPSVLPSPSTLQLIRLRSRSWP